MTDPALATVYVAIIGGVVTLISLVLKALLDRTARAANTQLADQVTQTGKAAAAQADESARQVGFDVGGVVSAAITAAVTPVSTRLAVVEGEVRVLRGDLVPVAVADRDIVLAAVADGLVHRDRVLLIPESVAQLYPHHLRTIPHPTPASPEENTP